MNVTLSLDRVFWKEGSEQFLFWYSAIIQFHRKELCALKRAILLDLPGNKASEKKTEELDDGQHHAGNSQRQSVWFDEVPKRFHTSYSVQSFLLLVAEECIQFSVWNFAAREWSAVHGNQPVIGRLQSTALEGFLDVIPADRDVGLVLIQILVHGWFQCRGDECVGRVLQDVSSYTGGQLEDENHTQKPAELK